MTYKTTTIGVYKFTPHQMYNLDFMKWRNESAIRLRKIRNDFIQNRSNPNFKFNACDYPLRPMPEWREQAK